MGKQTSLRNKKQVGALWFALLLIACGTVPRSTAATEEIHLSSTEVVDGSLLVVTLKSSDPDAVKKYRASLGETNAKFFPSPELGPGMYQALIGVPFNTAQGSSKVVVKVMEGDSERKENLSFDIIDGNYPYETLSVNPRKVKPKPKDMVRIQKENKALGIIYRTYTEKRYWTGPFVKPIASDMTSFYGTKRIFNGELQSFHSGVDLKAAVGTPIYSAAPGVVVMRRNLFFTGNTVIIDHGYGVYTLYAHMSEFKIKQGATVKANQLIGLAGKTGRATGPHLHWAAVINHVKVNPVDLTRVLK